jgi:hypothetical protein
MSDRHAGGEKKEDEEVDADEEEGDTPPVGIWRWVWGGD